MNGLLDNKIEDKVTFRKRCIEGNFNVYEMYEFDKKSSGKHLSVL